jgi:methylated-DNA-protein-cysteine methyltransferase-like protein
MRGSGPTIIPEYARRVLDVVDRIPRGKVMAYGDIAGYLGDGGPRQVGAVMREYGHEVPWHRVLMTDGRPAPHKEHEQLELLRADGLLAHNGRINMSVARWNPYADLEPRIRAVLSKIHGVVEKPSRFRDDTAYWVGGTEIAHLDDAGVVDVRLTRAVLRENKELLSDKRVHQRGRGSDWVEVAISDRADLVFLSEIAELAAAAHR